MRAPIPRLRWHEEWTADIVNPDGSRGRLKLDADQPGSLTWDADGIDAVLTAYGTPPDLLSDQRVELSLWVNGARAAKFPPLVPVKCDPVVEDHDQWFTLHLLDETVILAADGLDFAQVLDAGTPIVPAMESIAATSAPDLRIIWPDVDHTLRNPVELALSSSPLAGINMLGEALNARPLQPGRDGTLAVELWTPANLRAPQMEFGTGELAAYEPRVDLELFLLEAPNVVHFVAEGSAAADQIVGRWRDEDATSDYSIANRGRRILTRLNGEAATQEIADAKARRAGIEARGRGRRARMRGPYQPLIPYEVAALGHPDHATLDGLWEIESLTAAIGETSNTDWVLKEVI